MKKVIIGIIFNAALLTNVAFAQNLIPILSLLLFDDEVGLVINEIEYDQASTNDTGEYIEIYNPGTAAVSLAGLSVVLIDGLSSVNAEYQRVDLTPAGALAPDEYLVVASSLVAASLPASAKVVLFSLSQNNIQNGWGGGLVPFHGDAVVLFDTVADKIVDAVAYEGDINSASILGSSVALTLSQQQQSDVSARKGSLSRIPNGQDTDGDDDFLAPAINTPGAENRFLDGLVISEIDYDQVGSDTLEFIEIFNDSTNNIDLSEIAVVLVNGSNNSEYNRYDLSALGTLTAGSRLIIGSNTLIAGLPVGSLTIDAGTNFIQNGGDAVVLFDLASGSVIDALSYEAEINNAVITGQTGTFDLVSGNAFAGVDSGAGSLIQTGNSGDDASDWAAAFIPTPGNAPIVPVTGLHISEIDYDQVGSDTLEFIEILNGTASNISLSNVAVVLINGGSNSEYNRYDLSALGTLAAGSRLVVGSNTLIAGLPAGSLTIDAGTNFIQNGGDAVVLFDLTSGTVIDALSYEAEINNAVITGQAGPFDLVSGNAFTGMDSGDGSLIQVGDSGDDANDWDNAGTSTPGG